MATITKTIGASGDYADLTAAAAAWEAFTIAGATVGDTVRFEITGVVGGQFKIASASYAGFVLTSDSGDRYDGIDGSGAGIAADLDRSGTNEALIEIGVAVDFEVSWLEIYSPSFETRRLIALTVAATSNTVLIHHNYLHDNRYTGNAAVYGVYLNYCNAYVENNLFANIGSSGAGSSTTMTIYVRANNSTDTVVQNNTIYNTFRSSGTGFVLQLGDNTASGPATLNDDTGDIYRNNLFLLPSGSASGIIQCMKLLSSYSDTIVEYNGTSDTTADATFTGSLVSLSPSSEIAGAGAADYRLATGATAHEAGTDLGTTSRDTHLDILGYDRDANSSTWSLGAFQQEVPAVNSITLDTPEGFVFQRTGTTAAARITGQFSGSTASIEYRHGSSESWAELEASPSGGTFDATVTLTNPQETLEVRFSDDTGVTDSADYIGVGDVVIPYGQSNLVQGYDNPQVYDSPGGIKAFVIDQDDTAPRELIEPATTSNPTNGSVFPLLARQWVRHTSRPVLFLTCAVGGTSVGTQWASGGAAYTLALATIGRLAPNGIALGLLDIGEQDITEETPPATYQTEIEDLIARLQTDSGFTFPTVLAVTGTRGSNGSGTNSIIDGIRGIQRALPGTNGSVYRGWEGYDRATTHWETDTAAGIHHRRMWMAVEDALFSGTYGEGPKPVSATLDGSTITIAWDSDLRDNGSYEAGSWVVTDDAVEVALSADPTRTAAREVQILLASVPTGDVLVSLGSGNDASGYNVPQSLAKTLPEGTGYLPAIPFSALAAVRQKLLNAEPGSVVITGTDATLKVSRRLSADAGSLSITGTAATLTVPAVSVDPSDGWICLVRSRLWTLADPDHSFSERGTMTTTAVLMRHVEDSDTYFVDCEPLLEAGETITAATVATDDALTLGAAEVFTVDTDVRDQDGATKTIEAGHGVKFAVSGGAASGKPAVIKLTLTKSTGSTAVTILPVRSFSAY